MEVDRRAAIRAAAAAAPPGDVLLIAGKGHEDYQIVGHHEAPLRRSRGGGGRARGAGAAATADVTARAAPPVDPRARGARDEAARSCRPGARGPHVRRRGHRQPRGRARASSSSRSRASASTGSTSPRRRRPPGAAGVVVARGARRSPPGCADVAVIAVDDPRRGARRPGARRARRSSAGGSSASPDRTARPRPRSCARRRCGPLGRGAAHAGQPQHRRRPAADHPVGDRRRGGLGAGDGDARARARSRYLADIARPDIGVDHQRRGGAPRDARLDRRGGARQGRALRAGSGPTAIGASCPPTIRCIAAQAAAGARRAAAHLRRAQRAGDVRVLDFVPAGAAGSVVRYAVRGHAGRRAAAARRARTTRATAPRRWRWRWRPGVAPVAAAAALETVALPPHRSAPRGGRRPHHPRRLLQRQPGVDAGGARAVALAAAGGAGGGARAFAILGDMLELGPDAEAAHRGARPRGGRRAWPASAAVGALAPVVIDAARAPRGCRPSARVVARLARSGGRGRRVRGRGRATGSW